MKNPTHFPDVLKIKRHATYHKYDETSLFFFVIHHIYDKYYNFLSNYIWKMFGFFIFVMSLHAFKFLTRTVKNLGLSYLLCVTHVLQLLH